MANVGKSNDMCSSRIRRRAVSTTTKPFQQLIGQTEKTLNAILDRQLGDTVSEPEWVALVLISNSGGSADRQEFTNRIAHALKVDHQAAASHVGQLKARGLVHSAPRTDSDVALTEAGQQFVGQVQQQVAAITRRLWGDLPATDMDVAQRVLSTVLERAEAELSSAAAPA
jgi:DNA-binding MarR family transcriptional regulator